MEKIEHSSAGRCDRLRQIIADYPRKFTSFRRGSPSSNPWQNASIWKASALYPKTRCEVWGWGKGRSNYSCQWEEPGVDAARSAYDEYTPKIQSCLGSDWNLSEPRSKTGKESVFRSKSTRAEISIRYFQDSQSIWKPWYTALIVGDLVETLSD